MNYDSLCFIKNICEAQNASGYHLGLASTSIQNWWSLISIGKWIIKMAYGQ